MASNNVFSSFTNTEVSVKERNILKNVYGWMSAGLGVTGLTAFAVASNPQIVMALMGNTISLILLFAVQFGLVIYLSSRIQAMSRNTATFAFLGYAFVTGITFSSIFYAFSVATIFKAFITSAAMFFGMAIYAQTTKKDLSGVGYYSRMALWGIIISMFINFFFKSAMLDYFISVIGVFVFLGLTAWDVQKIKRTNDNYGSQMTEIDVHRASIYGALTLYLDFINMFLFLLRIFGGNDN
jgi:FtsH-binding integral membrane protein